MFSPLMRMLPRPGLSKPAMDLSRVDLPAPLGPMTPTISPASTEKSTPFQNLVRGAVADDQPIDAEQAQRICRFRPMYASCTLSLRDSASKLPSARFFPSASTTT